MTRTSAGVPHEPARQPSHRCRAWWELEDDDLAPALIFVVLAAFALVVPAHNDTFCHLRSGQEMWRTGALLTREVFSHTAYGAELSNHWWLTQVAFHGLYAIGGPFLLTAFAGACAFTAVAGAARLMRGPMELRLVLLLFLLLATAPSWSIRPQVLSLLLLVVMAHLLVRERLGWLPVVCLFWANAHALVIFGVALAAAAAVEALIWSRHRLKASLIAATLCAAVPMLSPLGWHYWPGVIRTVTLSRTVELQEYRMPLEAADLPFWIVLAGLVVVAFRRWHALGGLSRGDRILLAGSALLGVAAVLAARNIAFFAVIAAPALSRLVVAPDYVERQRPRPASRPAYAIVAVAAGIAAAVVASRWADADARLGWRPISHAAVAAVASCPGPLFNHFEDGGYLMWALPDRRIFVDGRMEAYPLEFLARSREADLRGDYEDLFRDYQITCAIVYADSPLRQRLDRDPSMERTHSDGRRTVFSATAAARGHLR